MVRWKEEEKEYLLKNHGVIKLYEIAENLGRTKDSVQKMAKSLGLSRSIVKTKWTDSELKYLEENYGSLKVEIICNELGRSKDSVSGKAQSLGLKGIIQGEWSTMDLKFLKENFKTMSNSELAKELNRTVKAVQIKLSRENLGRERIQCFDNTYFESIDTEEKAYWLGFISADGYVSKTESSITGGSSYCFGMELSSVDRGHLEKFNSSIKGNAKIAERIRKGRSMSNLRVYSKKFVEDLVDKGIVYRKTSILEFPDIDKNLFRHFIRGFFDGDGYVSFTKRKTYGYTKRTGFTCNSESFTKSILKILSEELGLDISNRYYKDGNNFNYDSANLKETIAVLDYLYKDSSIYLDRKYQKYLEIKKHLSEKIA